MSGPGTGFSDGASSPVQIALGIDPNPGEVSAFPDALERHARLLGHPAARGRVRWLKPNLSFFLRHGSRGLAALEAFVSRFRDSHLILLDAKFSEIENSLKASLTFTFETLGAHGVTINPFLGEGGIRLALEMCMKHAGDRGRVHVLCRTSEASEGALSHMQAPWPVLVGTVASLARQASGGDAALASVAGVVVGAGRKDVLLSRELRESGLSVLAPGLGAQGASWSVVRECAGAGPREILFPVSRAVFAGGEADDATMASNLENVLSLGGFP